MAQPQHTSSLTSLEEALTVLFCLIDDAYTTLNPRGAYRYETLKHLSDSEVITLALFQQLRGGGERALLLARLRTLLLAPVPGSSGALPFLVQPTHKEAKALLGVRKACGSLRTGGRTRDLAHRLDAAFCPPSAPGQPVRGLYGRRMG